MPRLAATSAIFPGRSGLILQIRAAFQLANRPLHVTDQLVEGVVAEVAEGGVAGAEVVEGMVGHERAAKDVESPDAGSGVDGSAVGSLFGGVAVIVEEKAVFNAGGGSRTRAAVLGSTRLSSSQASFWISIPRMREKR